MRLGSRTDRLAIMSRGFSLRCQEVTQKGITPGRTACVAPTVGDHELFFDRSDSVVRIRVRLSVDTCKIVSASLGTSLLAAADKQGRVFDCGLVEHWYAGPTALGW